MMGLVFVTMFLGNMIIGWLGILFERMSTASFWGIHALIAAIGGILVLMCGRRLARVLDTEGT
jgi:POT family proton-dependent oligopeptide transporter